MGVTGGSWTYTTGILGSGAHTIDASSTDSAGNTGGAARWDLNVAAEQFFANPQVAPEDQDVLGEQTEQSNTTSVSDQAVKGASDEKTGTGLTLLGIAWYWWLVVAAGVAGLWWLIATLRRGAKEESL